MSANRFLSLSILVAALAATASGAVAASEYEPVRRADVKAAVLQARANGELLRAGEAMQAFPLVTTGESTLTRRRVRDDVLVARALGQLASAGERGMTPIVAVGPQMARADVRESVRVANLHGELIPAGERMGTVHVQAKARMARAEMVAARRAERTAR